MFQVYGWEPVLEEPPFVRLYKGLEMVEVQMQCHFCWHTRTTYAHDQARAITLLSDSDCTSGSSERHSTYVSRDLSFIGSRSCCRFQSAWVVAFAARCTRSAKAQPRKSCTSSPKQNWVCPVLDLPKAEGPGRTSLQMRTEYKSVFWETQTERGWYSSQYWADCYGGLWLIQTCAHMSWSSEAIKADWPVAVEWLLIMTCCCY